MPVTSTLKTEKEWQAAFDQFTQTHQRLGTDSAGITLSLKVPKNEFALTDFAETLQDDLLRIVKGFMNRKIVTRVKAELADRQGGGLWREHSPMYFKADEDPNTANRNFLVADSVVAGFTDLSRKLQQVDTQVSDGGYSVTATLGKGVYDLRADNYGPKFGGNSAFRTWFLSAELGTGIADNVGGGNVRQSGVTKDASGDGSWWLPEQGIGAHYIGQKGLHIFWDPKSTNRKPLAFWQKIFNEDLPNHMQKEINRLIADANRGV